MERERRRKKEEREREGGGRGKGGERESTAHPVPGESPWDSPSPQLTWCGFEQLLLPRGHNTIGALTVQVHMCMYRCGCERALPGRGGGVASAASHTCLSLCPLLSLAPSLLSA